MAGLLLGSAAVSAEALVQMKSEPPFLHVYAEIETKVDRKTAWNVLTDYNHWSEFVPDLQVCRVISKPGEPVRLEQRGQIPQMPNFPLVIINQFEEIPPKTIRFQRVAGNVKSLMGEWQIKGITRVRLIYRAIVEPGFPAPPELSSEIFRHDAKVRLEAMAKEMARRVEAKGGAQK
jgi:hypothetical protein